MNSTVWNTEDTSLNFVLGTISTFVHGYAMFMCFAIHDYQNEKPREEISPIDVLVKDFMTSSFLLLSYSYLVHLISLSIPPTISINAYLISHIGTFITNFESVSMLITLYIQHICVFYSDQFSNLNVFP